MVTGRSIGLHKVRAIQVWLANLEILDIHTIALTLGVFGEVNNMEFELPLEDA